MCISILVPEKHAGDEITYQSHVHSQIACCRDIKNIWGINVDKNAELNDAINERLGDMYAI